MRLALTKGTLQIPPTYFAVQQALALHAIMPDVEVHAFTFASDVRDPQVRAALPVTDAVPARLGPLALARGVRSRLAWIASRHLSAQIRDWSPDLIHQHAATWSLPAVRAARSLGVPLVTTLHGIDAFGGSVARAVISPSARAAAHWMQRNLDAAGRESDAVLAVSRYLADVAVRNAVPTRALHVHYQGVDTDWFTPGEPGEHGQTRARDGRAGSRVPEWSRACDHSRELLFVGALSPLKGVLDLLAVTDSLADRHPHRLTIVGDGPLAPQVRAAAMRHPDRVRWLGPLDRAGVRECMRAADALVLPTRTMADGRAEAAGLVLLEAQACATPVVVNAVGGTPEMMVDGVTGLATREGDRDSLADALTRILTLPGGDLTAMGQEARAWVVAERSLSGSVERLRRIYATLLDG